MRGRHTLCGPSSRRRQHFDLDEYADFVVRHDTAPQADIPVIGRQPERTRRVLHPWGPIPSRAGRAPIGARPDAVFVATGNDGRGTHAEIDRIAPGYGWKGMHDGLIARGEPVDADPAAAEEAGMTLASGLSCAFH